MAAFYNTLGVLIFVMALGAFSRMKGILTSESKKIFSSYVYYFGLPTLFFLKISEIDFSHLDLRIIFGSLLPIAVLILLLFVLHVFGLLGKHIFVLLGLSCVFGSNAFFGIAFFETLMGNQIVGIAVVSAGLLGLVGVFLSLVLFEYATAQRLDIKIIGKALFNPLVASIVAGFIFSFFGYRLGFIGSGLLLIGKTATGIAIFVLGMFIWDNFSIQIFKASCFYALFRVFALGLTTIIIVSLVSEKRDLVYNFLLLQGGIPAAVSLAIFSQKYEYKIPEITGMVIITSILSFVSLGLLYWLFH